MISPPKSNICGEKRRRVSAIRRELPPRKVFPGTGFYLRSFPGRRDLPQTLLPLSETGWGLHLRGKMFFSPFFTKEGFSFILEM
ncbi:hypothetical protein B4135_1262 [Caldibacillus debilis]|uniref:Uncharacterized protein n=1 Tax=Caldibacillus debilis TaxID=301148 RepID=A0A150MDY8_9BACI|nr:hypothetical protein B4135_1262 [Caldibacillus debilis]